MYEYLTNKATKALHLQFYILQTTSQACIIQSFNHFCESLRMGINFRVALLLTKKSTEAT